MQTFITTTLASIDAGINTYARDVFIAASGPVSTLIMAAGIVALPLIALNSVMQFRPISMSSYFTWAIRYVIILAVATSWTQFSVIFTVLTTVPDTYGALLLAQAGGAPGSASSLNTEMDRMVSEIFNFADRANASAGLVGISFAAVIMSILGAIMATVAIIVSGIAKIGLGLAVGLAPIMVASLMFRSTSQLFESWTRFTIGFALIPLILAGIMGVIIGVGSPLITTASGATDFSGFAGFAIVVLSAIFLMFQVPTLASGLSGSIVAAAGAALVAVGVSRLAGGAGRVSAGVREANAARQADGTRGQVASAALAGLRQTSFQRQGRREQLRLESLADQSPRPRTAAGRPSPVTTPTGPTNGGGPNNSTAAAGAAAGNSRPSVSNQQSLLNQQRALG